jgi:hypothetical protein
MASHKLMLKKISRTITSGQAVLHVSSAQEDISEKISPNNQYLKIQDLSELETRGIKGKSFTYIVADLDCPALDDFDYFLNQASKLIIKPGLLIVVASDLLSDKIALFFGNPIVKFKRPYRAVTPGYLRETLMAHGAKVKNRFWRYDEKLLIMADL